MKTAPNFGKFRATLNSRFPLKFLTQNGCQLAAIFVLDNFYILRIRCNIVPALQLIHRRTIDS